MQQVHVIKTATNAKEGPEIMVNDDKTKIFTYFRVYFRKSMKLVAC